MPCCLSAYIKPQRGGSGGSPRVSNTQALDTPIACCSSTAKIRTLRFFSGFFISRAIPAHTSKLQILRRDKTSFFKPLPGFSCGLSIFSKNAGRLQSQFLAPGNFGKNQVAVFKIKQVSPITLLRAPIVPTRPAPNQAVRSTGPRELKKEGGGWVNPPVS